MSGMHGKKPDKKMARGGRSEKYYAATLRSRYSYPSNYTPRVARLIDNPWWSLSARRRRQDGQQMGHPSGE